jgi:hypothetical protein
MTKIKVILFIILLFGVSSSLFAILMGKGEVTGQVLESWLSDDRVIFRLNISEQKNEEGPRLGDGNNFAFAGSSKIEITEGDVIRLRYNSSDDHGIRVEQVEFIENKPGTVQQTRNFWWVLLPLVIVAAATTFLLIKRRRTKI